MIKQTSRPYPKEDFRKEFVVNILIGFIIAEVTLLYLIGKINSLEFTLTAIPFLSLYFISKLGFYKLSFLFGILYLSIITLIIMKSGNEYEISSVFVSILLMILIYSLSGTYSALLYFIFISFTLIYLPNINPPKTHNFGTISQNIVYPLLLDVALCVGWLPNQRLKESFRKQRYLDKLLRAERDMLDMRLKQRTENLFKLADIGTSTQRLIHDISTPLNVVLMNISKVTPHNMKMAQLSLKKAQYSTKTMVDYINEIRNKIREQDKKLWFELSRILDTVKYLCETSNVSVTIVQPKRISIYGNETRFLQLVTNIVQNSIESYADKKGAVCIKVYYIGEGLKLTISDKGKGMDHETLERLGEITSKEDMLLHGMGYKAAEETIRMDFQGKITTRSANGRGTKTTIYIKAPTKLDNGRVRQP